MNRFWKLLYAAPILLSLACCFGQQDPNLVLQQPTTLSSGTTTYQATNSVTSATTFVIQSAAAVTFSAGCVIQLGPGFQAIAGTAAVTFQTAITGGSCSSWQQPGMPASQLPPASNPSKEYVRMNGQVIAIENHH